MSIVAFLLVLGLVVRLTRLLVDDGITQSIRDWLLFRAQPEPVAYEVTSLVLGHARTATVYDEGPARFKNKVAQWFWDLLDCPWCTSVHVAFWVVLVANLTGHSHLDWFWFSATVASLAWLTGLASTLVGVLHGLERVEAKAVETKG